MTHAEMSLSFLYLFYDSDNFFLIFDHVYGIILKEHFVAYI